MHWTLKNLAFLMVTCLVILPAREKVTAANLQGSENAKEAPPLFEKNTLPAAGRQAAILNISRFGRYAITVKSEQGTALQWVDHMAGPGETAGTPGEKDGRLDLFLEKGRYQIITRGHPHASGIVRLDAHAFRERTQAQPPELVELKPVEDALQDYEQLSYWIEISSRRRVVLEAAGRNLADLRLWKEGNWLVDAAPTTQISYPKAGQPLLTCRLSADLDPGLYLLTAYGGPTQPWSEESQLHPFYLRFGIPRLGLAARRRYTMSPFGVDRFLVPGPVTFFRVELPEARATTFKIDRFNPNGPFENNGSPYEITKNSVPPLSEALVQGLADKDHVMTITAEAGQTYLLQQFEYKYEYPFRGSKDYWISTVHSGHAADSVDATAIVARYPSLSTAYVEPYLNQTIELDAKSYWHRRVNLLDQMTVFLHAKESGSYQLLCRGVEAQYRIEPFFINRPPSYQTPPARACGSSWDLDAGYYVMTVIPMRKGIGEFLLRPYNLMDVVFDMVGIDRGKSAIQFHAAARFPKVYLDEDRPYALYLNRQPGVKAGVILRPLPLDLANPLFISQEAGETVTAPFQTAEAGVLRAEAEDGSLLEIAMDGGPWKTEVPVEAGNHTATVRHARQETVNYTLLVIPRRLDSKTPLPALSPQALSSLPVFPVLTEPSPLHFDLAPQGTATVLVRAEKPALYQVQTTGLLATMGNLRSRTIPSFVKESQNGVGRNFSIQQYLHEGDYQITVGAEGHSAGHLGLSLTQTEMLNGGFLTSRVPARVTLAPGQAIAYYFTITNPGEFRLHALGQDRTFRCRLEDKDGWPIETPNIEANLTRYYAPGRYRLVILPEITTARVVTLIEPSPRTRRFKGHGPHILPLAQRIEHIWLEPEVEGPRSADLWQFNLPAPIDAAIELTGEMQGNLLKVEDSGSTSTVAFVPPARGWKGALPMGRYRLEAVSMRRNNRAPYQVAIWPEQLVAGLSREISAPASIPLSVGKTSLIELSSFGSDDVQAHLFDGKGNLVAANDDRPNDWNFQISESLSTGLYRLEVEPVGKQQALCRVSMLAPQQEDKPALSLPVRSAVSLGRTVQLFPLTLQTQLQILALSATASESVGLAVEALQGEIWRVLGTDNGKKAHLEIPLPDGDEKGPTAYRLRLWSLDRRETRVLLNGDALIPQNASEAQLGNGLTLSAQTSTSPLRGAAMIQLDRPGIFHLAGDATQLSWCPGFYEVCQPAPDGTLLAPRTRLWVVGELSQESGMVLKAQASRVMLSRSSGNSLQFLMPPQIRVHCDLGGANGGPALVLASSQEGQPAVQIMPGIQPDVLETSNLAIFEHSAATVALEPRDAVARVWAATKSLAGFQVRLEPHFYPPPKTSRVSGSWDGFLENLEAQSYELPPGPKRIQLTLGDSLIGVFSQGTMVESVHWRGGHPFSESVECSADRLTLLHTRKEEDRFAVELIPLSPEDLTPPLAPGFTFERNHIRSGIMRIKVAPSLDSNGKPYSLHTRGACEESTFVGKTGQVLRGTDFEIPPEGGTLEIAHSPGLLISWIDRPGEETEDLWSRREFTDSVEIIPPTFVKLQGMAQSFRFNLSTPSMLHVRLAAPSISLLKRAGDSPVVEVHPEGTLMDAFLPAGPSELRLRAVAGSALAGAVEITSTPITPIGEGLGPEVLLAPAAVRLFSFEVSRSGPVGIGVRASADIVETVLLSHTGRPLGKGTVQMPILQPGTYYLALQAPANSVPVRACPALAGIKPPDTGPPEEVIRRYLQPEETPPQFTSTRRTTPAEEVEEETGEGEGEPSGEGTDSEAPDNPPSRI